MSGCSPGEPIKSLKKKALWKISGSNCFTLLSAKRLGLINRATLQSLPKKANTSPTPEAPQQDSAAGGTSGRISDLGPNEA
jgi:hypothetical protein